MACIATDFIFFARILGRVQLFDQFMNGDTLYNTVNLASC